MILFSEHFSGGLEVCENASKRVFNHYRLSKNIFVKDKIQVIWKYAKMHQNTFLTTPDGQKYLFSEHFSGGLEVCENASKHDFNHSRRSKITFFRTFFWWSGSMQKCIKTRF
jgi:hypothetical protein